MQLASLVLASIASTVAVVSAQSAASNATAYEPTEHVASNAYHARGTRCFARQPANGVDNWYYNNRNDGPYFCYGRESWSMLKAYRAGGALNVHWKYTDNVNDPECLPFWKYYAEDGTTLIASINGRTTMQGDSRRWCALPVYRSGGVFGNQWQDCTCYDDN